MALVSLHQLKMAFGADALLDGVNLQLEEGDRLCLMGRNGTGKSTLLKLLAGQLTQDAGEIQLQRGRRVSAVMQEVPVELEGRVDDLVAEGLGETAGQLARYHALGLQLESSTEGPAQEALLAELETLQHQLESGEGFGLQALVERTLKRLDLQSDERFETLSGGTKRRVLLARALVAAPDLLLLDEPTNHLDIETILWLEAELQRRVKTLIFVTHDRAFARRLANRVAELDRGHLISFRCGYDKFIEKREALMEEERTRRALFDKKLAQEEVWIRKGIQARRTRNEGRVRALEKLREVYQARRSQQGKASFQMQEAGRSGALVTEVEDASFAFEAQPIVSHFSGRILRGDRVGIVGPNGCGKTTLLKILLGELQPQSGTIKLGTRRELRYFDQLREQLDLDKTVQENVGEGRDTLMIGGQPKHIIGYLQDFLFTPARIRSPVRVLSGGERNRLLLAKLFTQPFNLLVMDEPTNDLDIETLDLLEELLLAYKGTLLLVSHDRAFLNNVVTSTWVFEGEGRLQEYAGGYDDAMQQQAQARAEAAAAAESKKAAGRAGKAAEQRAKAGEKPSNHAAGKPKKLSFKEKRELEALPQQIAALEAEQTALHAQVADPLFYKQAGSETARINTRLANLEQTLEQTFERWQTLESRAQ